MPKTINIEGALRFGWGEFKKHWQFLIAACLIIYAISAVFDFLTKSYFKGVEPTATLVSLLSSLVIMWLYFNVLRAFLAIIDGRSPVLADLFAYDRSYLTYVIASFLYGLVVGVGFILLIVPGIYFTLRYGMYSYLIADRRLGVWESLRESARITTGAKWQLLLMGLVSIAVVALGFLALFVGALIALPVIGLAYAFIYRSLLSQSGENLPVASVTPPPAVVPPTPVVENNEAKSLDRSTTPPITPPLTPPLSDDAQKPA